GYGGLCCVHHMNAAEQRDDPEYHNDERLRTSCDRRPLRAEMGTPHGMDSFRCRRGIRHLFQGAARTQLPCQTWHDARLTLIFPSAKLAEIPKAKTEKEPLAGCRWT